MSILSQIITNRQLEVEKLKQLKPSLHSNIRPKNPHFLSFPDFASIAEIKPKSPNRGQIRNNFDPIKLIKEFESQKTSAIAVLTDQTYFIRLVLAEVMIFLLRREKVPITTPA